MFLAAYVLVATAVDRLIAVWKPIFYSQKSIPVRATVTSSLVWLVWAIISLPNLFIFDVEVRKGIANYSIFHQKKSFSRLMMISALFLDGETITLPSRIIDKLLVALNFKQRQNSDSPKRAEQSFYEYIKKFFFMSM